MWFPNLRQKTLELTQNFGGLLSTSRPIKLNATMPRSITSLCNASKNNYFLITMLPAAFHPGEQIPVALVVINDSSKAIDKLTLT
jgi:hypothetical protein